jgi:pimeloyl-ACP methyl ester carboxylesterase
MKTNKNISVKLILTVIFSLIGIQTLAQTTYGDNPNAGEYIVLNGVRHYYEVYGEGKPMLLIHGNSTATKGWKPQIEYFSKKYKVYSIDCRGRGKSELGKDTLTYMQQAKDMVAFIDKMKLDSVDVIGKSDGAIISLLMAIYYPRHIRKVVSFSANLWPDSTALYTEVLKEQHLERLMAEEKLRQKDTSQNWYLIQQRIRMMEFQPHISGEDLKKIDIPVLILSCDRDVIREEHTFFIYKNIRKANICFIPGEKHSVPRDNPAIFNLLTDKFLSEPFKDYPARF